MLINNKKKKKNIEAKDDKKERHLYHNKCDNSNENIQSKTNLTITQSYIYSMKNYKKNEEIYYEYAHTPFLPFYSSHRSMSDYEKKKKKKKKFFPFITEYVVVHYVECQED
ncbi:hypothetical protein PBSP11RLL_000115200 [Plasmodium berghei]|uniref:Uncharacterized protein n=1 Tax=Plasmodium berghei TaxID=5821 RepID=A0A1D3S7F3_PLABE|nr:hypothetical protein PBSP11RLL_000115200 [Plasmodium berghei]